MKRIVLTAALLLGAGFSTVASAKCYHYDDSLGEVYVCVGKAGRDDQADRNNTGTCFDENGNRNNDLSGY